MATMREINEARANRMQGGMYAEANRELIGDPSKAFPNTRQAYSTASAEATGLMKNREPLAAMDRVFRGAGEIARGYGADVMGGSRQIAGALANAPLTPSARESSNASQKPSALATAAPPVPPTTPARASQADVRRVDNAIDAQPNTPNTPPAAGRPFTNLGTLSTDELLARAERMRSIREGNTALRDNLNFNAGGALGRQYSQDEVIKNMSTSRSRSGRAAALGYYQGQNRNATELQGKKFDAQAAATADQLRAKAALELADKQGQWGMARTGLEAAGAYERSKIQADQRGIAAEMAGLYRILNNAEAPEIDRIQAERRLMELQYGAPEQELADGGLVYGMDDYQSAVGYARGGEVHGYGQVPSAAQALPQVNEYREYALGAKALGLPAIPFDQFLTMRQGAQQVAQAPGPVQPMTAMGFANGGKIPDPNDVSGKLVVDTDPNAPTDSIPAVVDGQMPAKLDSGEFVIPEDVVKFFGTDKLNKMIAQARQGQQAAGE